MVIITALVQGASAECGNGKEGGGAEDRIERKFCGQRWGEFLRYKFRTYLTLMFVYAAEIK